MRVRVLFLLLVGLTISTGCSGVTKSPAEISRTVEQSVDMDLRQITDDWNMIWLVDRQYRLSKWHMR